MKTDPKNTSVLLYSGGLDSFLAAKMIEPDVLLYGAIGHKYQKNELSMIAKSGVKVTVDSRLILGDLELPNAIIPLRNLYLIAMASHYGTTIALGALKGEVNPDKSETFRAQTETLLNTCYGESYWSAGDQIRVTYPLASMTKVQLLQNFEAGGGDVDEALRLTRSCYEAEELACGHCSACIKRYIATEHVGAKEQLLNDPHTSPYLDTMRERWPTFDEERKQETLAVFPELNPSERKQ